LFGPFFCNILRGMNPKLHLLALFSALFPLAKVPPCSNPALPTLLPSFQILLLNLLLSRIFHYLGRPLAFVSCIHPLKVIPFFFYLFKEWLSHLHNLNLHIVTGKFLQAFCHPARVFFASRCLNPVSCLSHHPLVHTSFIIVHQRFVGLFKNVKRIRCSLVLAFVRVDQDWQHSKLFLNFQVIGLLRKFQDVKWIYKLRIQKPVKLVVLGVLVIIATESLQLGHKRFELLFHFSLIKFSFLDFLYGSLFLLHLLHWFTDF